MTMFIRYLLWSLHIVVLMTIFIAWKFYPEPYSWTHENISVLGGVHTSSGADNPKASDLFLIGFMVVGFIAIFSGGCYLFIGTRFPIIKLILCFGVALGAFGTAFPHDETQSRLVHIIGTFMFVGSFTLLNAVLQLLRWTSDVVIIDVDYYVDVIVVIVAVS